MADEESIRAWLAEAARGDVLGAQKLIVAHHRRLRALAESRMPAELRARLDPDDLLQPVYAEVVERARGFEPRGPDSFFAWLATMLDSRIADARRREHAAVRDVAREAQHGGASLFERWLGSGVLETATPSRVAAGREEAALLHAALAGLSADQRRALELRYLAGRSLDETARELGRTVPAVQMLCLRALRNLRAAARELRPSAG